MEDFALDSCDDACSICLEQFTDQEPATVTKCKHEYHLQCILEWSQRSRECPICWQSLALTDPDSQELLAAVEVERSARTRHRFSDSSTAPQHVDSFDIDEHIMQHLRAATISRAEHFSRREYLSTRLNYFPQLLPGSPANGSPPTPSAVEQTSFPIENQYMLCFAPAEADSPPAPSHFMQEDTHFGLSNSSNLMGGPCTIYDRHGSSNTSILATQTPPASPQNMDQSDFLSFSESIKSKLSAASSRYKESISKSTQGFREMLLSQNNSIKELSKEVKREVSASIAGVAKMMERLDPTLNRKGDVFPVSHSTGGSTSKSPCIGNNPKEALTSGKKEPAILSDVPT